MKETKNMIKLGPMLMEKLEQKEIEKANPPWVRWVMGIFLALILMAAVWYDWVGV
jgi:hypothetical protein